MKDRAIKAISYPKAWVVEKDGETWTDNLRDDEACKEHINYCIAHGFGDKETFTYRKMSDEEMDNFEKGKA